MKAQNNLVKPLQVVEIMPGGVRQIVKLSKALKMLDSDLYKINKPN